MAPTITDVAEKAGVSVGTVSRYLNGYNLRERNVERIRKAIEELDYNANFMGMALRKQRSMTIGVLIYTYTDIYSTTILTSLERHFEQHNYQLLVCDGSASSNRRRWRLQALRQRSVDGLIVFPAAWGECEKQIEEFIKAGTPVVEVDGRFPGLELDRVSVDNRNACFRAVEKLIHRNHHRIGIVNGPEWEANARERYEGCQDALVTYDIELPGEYIKFGDYQLSCGYNATKELMALPEPPTALFTTSLWMTLGSVMALNELGIVIPDDISFIGFDHFDVFDITRPPLTVIEQPAEIIGEKAAELLMRRIKGDLSDFPVDCKINTRMLVRDSVRDLT